MTSMLTQCPDCHTLFRIRDEQLQTAAGKVHCCRCNGIFNALENLREAVGKTPPEASASTPARSAEDTPEQQPPISLSHLFEDQATAEPAMADLYPSELSELLDADKSIDVDIDIDVDLDQLEALENLAPSTINTEQTPQAEDDPGQQPPAEGAPSTPNEQRRTDPARHDDSESERGLPFDVPEQLPPIQPAAPEPARAAAQQGGGRKHTFAWSLLVVVLLLSALAQAAWFAREQLMVYPLARVAMQRFCALAGCQLPPRRDPSRIEVLSRSVKSHPEMPRVLQILLTFSNQADFDQPYPQIRLSLYSNNNELIARRRFNAEEYLGPSSTDRPLIAAGQSVNVELALERAGVPPGH